LKEDDFDYEFCEDCVHSESLECDTGETLLSCFCHASYSAIVMQATKVSADRRECTCTWKNVGTDVDISVPLSIQIICM
jgi:hypothetical protein